jgi:hypothetical protein
MVDMKRQKGRGTIVSSFYVDHSLFAISYRLPYPLLYFLPSLPSSLPPSSIPIYPYTLPPSLPPSLLRLMTQMQSFFLPRFTD